MYLLESKICGFLDQVEDLEDWILYLIVQVSHLSIN
jgi:hypothetical protein